jgi:pilus assembly protein Flp/PilA
MFSTIKTIVTSLRRDEKGATAIEYGLIAALVGIVLATAMSGLGTKLQTVFTTIAGKM